MSGAPLLAFRADHNPAIVKDYERSHASPKRVEDVTSECFEVMHGFGEISLESRSIVDHGLQEDPKSLLLLRELTAAHKDEVSAHALSPHAA